MMPFSSTLNAQEHHRLLSRRCWSSPDFDRVNVLGDDADYGHSGCVNALSWARDGELLLLFQRVAAMTQLQIWRMDPSVSHAYPFVCHSVIQTGHRANIFNVEMLPYSSKIVTVAGDGQARVHEGETGHSGPLSSRHTCTHRLQCHDDRVKRIVTEDSPHLFLTVGEDGAVRQHDLRTPHQCRSDSCPTPLVKVNFELSALSLSPLTPFQFVVAGDSAYGYLFDRRQAGRFLLEERGMVENGMTHCVRRFGRPSMLVQGSTREHITGARMSSYNGHEVLLSYHADAVYLYSTRDDPEEEDMTSSSQLLPSNKALSKEPPDGHFPSSTADDMDMDMDIDDNASDDDEGHDFFRTLDDYVSQDPYSGVPTILPRRRFPGARNIATIKDANFLGSADELVTSGSDCGNVFIWRKSDATLHALLEGDSTIVNVIEGHPHLPLFAASGIDTTVKLFAPVSGPSAFSRMASADRIIAANTAQRRGPVKLRRSELTALVTAVTADDSPQCNHQ